MIAWGTPRCGRRWRRNNAVSLLSSGGRMIISTKHDDAAVHAIAARWGLAVKEQIAETRRARLFKVETADGFAVMKFYKEYGSSGEGAAIPFLMDLKPGTGPRILRKTLGRTVVLMEWLDGPTLGDLLAAGQEAEALRWIGQVARRIQQSQIRLPRLYQRMAPGRPRDLKVPGRSSQQIQSASRDAIRLLTALTRSMPRQQVIHGDLGFGNVILTKEGPRLIDPKGLRADPVREYAKVLNMPFDGLPVATFEETVQRRANQLGAEAQIAPGRILGWAAIELAGRFAKRAKTPDISEPMLPYLNCLLGMSDAG